MKQGRGRENGLSSHVKNVAIGFVGVRFKMTRQNLHEKVILKFQRNLLETELKIIFFLHVTSLFWSLLTFPKLTTIKNHFNFSRAISFDINGKAVEYIL